ncbi:serine/threonine-protein kinase [Nocardia sp. CDC160]|uniref:serine/threonine-protein kinase n=1 Tax=Nocardia sp. CDC160 TaxID=3112166 RepID=UPI002DBC4687|nr:bifunctional serine/threonine protein kinase/MFS transporter [Nocardia sp. CDC160]MEC3917818.1 bifunctional serine/threonine protein kinase/MFS transporter [Nocardia sp. CDC160]
MPPSENHGDHPDFAGYRVERRLGAGGMGEVYLARHPRLPRHDALKILSDKHADNAEFRARFLREAEIAVRLQHPNVVAVRDRGEQEGRLWIAMQYVDGMDVAELIGREGSELAIERTIRILSEAAQGLDEIHRVGLLHLDVKPANILLAEDPDGQDRVLVTDFGISRVAGEDENPTEAGGFTATLAYAAPEQIGGETVDHRADVYALGCTLYHMLTGSVPYPRDSPAAVMYAHLLETPPQPSAENSRVPVELDAVIARALAKDPAERYPSCGALAAAAREAWAERADALPGRRIGRRRVFLAGLALVASIAVAVPVSLAVAGRSDESRGSAATSRAVIDADAWGTAALIAQTFPGLLPVAPTAPGYQGLHLCLQLDAAEKRESDQKFISLDEVVPKAAVTCAGDGDPIDLLTVTCNNDRTPLTESLVITQLEGEEQWSRPSGTGRVRWGTNTNSDGKAIGKLEVSFDGTGRNFCRLRASSQASGSELRERWWPSAPI